MILSLALVLTLIGGAKGALSDLNDEFDDAASLSSWKRHYAEEQWGNQLEKYEISDGKLFLQPYACGWYEDRRGPHVYKEVTANDFVIHAMVRASGRAQRVPNKLYSLGGVFIRESPSYGTSANWVSGEENYIFMSIGAADSPGTPQYEVKSTTNSVSLLEKVNTPGAELSMEIRVARLRSSLFVLAARFATINETTLEAQSYTDWTVYKRYMRNDWSSVATLNVGFTAYTDWDTVDNFTPEVYNNKAQLTTGPPDNGAPDLNVYIEYARFAAPDEALLLAIGADAAAIDANGSDEELMRAMGVLELPVAQDWCISSSCSFVIEVYQGTKVTWTNTDSFKHNVQTVSGVSSFTSPDLFASDTFTYTFNDVGVVNIICAYHGGMTGKVTVLATPAAPSGAAASGNTTLAPTAAPTADSGDGGASPFQLEITSGAVRFSHLTSLAVVYFFCALKLMFNVIF